MFLLTLSKDLCWQSLLCKTSTYTWARSCLWIYRYSSEARAQRRRSDWVIQQHVKSTLIYVITLRFQKHFDNWQLWKHFDVYVALWYFKSTLTTGNFKNTLMYMYPLLFLPHILGIPLRLNTTHSVLLQSQCKMSSRECKVSRPRMSDSVQLFFQVLVDVSLADLKSTLTRVATLKALWFM